MKEMKRNENMNAEEEEKYKLSDIVMPINKRPVKEIK
jgi:hypothetical protein